MQSSRQHFDGYSPPSLPQRENIEIVAIYEGTGYFMNMVFLLCKEPGGSEGVEGLRFFLGRLK